MRQLLTLILAPAMATLFHAVAAAQGAPLPWSVAGTAGLFAAHGAPSEAPGYYDKWFETYGAGVVVGRHIARHVIVEIEASTTGTGRQFVEQHIMVPGLAFPYSVGTEAATTIRSIGGHVTYQFRDNEWVHPFVRAGVTADVERTVLRSLGRFYYPGPRGAPPVPIEDPGVDGPTTDVRARLTLSGGAKVYLLPRVFLRPDGAMSLGIGRQTFVARLGIGVDF